MNKALATPTVQEQFATAGNVPMGGTPEEFAALVQREAIKWAEIIKAAGIKAE